jgi:hypothetical protein
MTSMQPPITDERLDSLVRQVLVDRAEEIAADALSASGMAERIATRLRPAPLRRSGVLLAAATLLTVLVIGGALVAGVQPRLPWVRTVPALPSGSSLPSPAALPSPVEYEVTRGWPDTSQNPAGVYSWNGAERCGMSCVMGFMHNGYGPGNVEIRIDKTTDGSVATTGTIPATVAGHEARYRRIGTGVEQWRVEIEGTTVVIVLTAREGASEAELDEAHAIIESMRTQVRPDYRIGFELIFTLTTDDWDSG